METNLTDNEKRVLQAVIANPGIQAGELGNRLGMDRNYAGRVADRLIGFGHLAKRDNGQGFAFFPANGGGYAAPNREQSRSANPASYSPSSNIRDEPLEGR